MNPVLLDHYLQMCSYVPDIRAPEEAEQRFDTDVATELAEQLRTRTDEWMIAHIAFLYGEVASWAQLSADESGETLREAFDHLASRVISETSAFTDHPSNALLDDSDHTDDEGE